MSVAIMHRYLKRAISIAAVAILATTHIAGIFADSTTSVLFQIGGGIITIGGPSSLTFTSTVTASLVAQSFSQDFNTNDTGYFFVLDLQGADTGYSTTFQLSGMFNESGVDLSGAYVTFKADGPTVVTMSGTDNPNVILDANATGGYQSLHTPKTWIYRDPGANTGVIGQYGQYIDMQINLPANQAPGNYQGTLVYTFLPGGP